MYFINGIFPIIFFLIFFSIIGLFIFAIFSGIAQWNKNNNSPVLTVDAKVVTKRSSTSHSKDSTSSTWYYATFEFDSGDRMEFSVSGSEYGLLVEGDIGKLTFQGTRYKNFERYK